MKLSRNKISKLRKCRNQSRKNYRKKKQKGKLKKHRSFRKKKSLNLRFNTL